MIKQKLRAFFLRDPAKPMFWLLLGLLVKGMPFLFLFHNKLPSDIPGAWGGTMTDSHSYFEPIENLLKTGTYLPDYRMPGYGFVYLLFRFIFSPAITCNIILVLQFLFAGISVYYLALTAKSIFKNDNIFYVCFYLYLFSTYSNFFDGWLLTESFCSSALIFGSWFFVHYYEKGQVKYLFFSGLLFTWAMFLRPVFLPLIFILVFVMILQKRPQTPKWALNGGIQSPFRGLGLTIPFFLLPFLICEGTWVVKNSLKYHHVIILTSAELAPTGEKFYEPPLFHFLHSWGASGDFTDNKSYLLWFGFHLKGMPNPKSFKDSLPDYIYTSQFNKDSLLWIKSKVIALNDSALSPAKRFEYMAVVKEKLDRYTLSVKKEKPLLYYFKSPFLHCLPRFLFGEESKLYMKRFQLPGILGSFMEYFFTIFYYMGIFLGVLGGGLLFFTGLKKNPLALIVVLIPAYTIIIHALIIRITYNRFLMPAWPFLMVCVAYVFVTLFRKKAN